ncbi:homing endonuclease associated repeat-containing protein [Paenibacillus cremeus]|uniref:Uncharacterized protein n=1 Tax=Paenibacillus cremeus TaxID=2163881 RepID=A0A559KCY3_9BACL|nr:hypothetical protein [Paenibacillus cremeus]TVY09982.1 hypothetical protein FPZ49_11465 [Paenibacillus cremeus]
MGGIKWNKEDDNVLIELYNTAEQEEILSKLLIKRGWPQIVLRAMKLGLQRSKEAKYGKQTMSEEFLINELKRFSYKYNKTPYINGMNKDKEFPSSTVFEDRFGSWNNALIAAGFELNSLKVYDKEYLMKEAIDFYEKNNRSPYYNELSFSSNIIRHYWPSWNEFLIDCNLPINKNYHSLKTKEDGITFLKQFYEGSNKKPTKNDLKNLGLNDSWFALKFGSYNKALFEAGLVTDDKIITKNERIDRAILGLKNLFSELGYCPTVQEYDEYAKKHKLSRRRNLEGLLGLNYNDICLKYIGEANIVKRSKEELIEILNELKNKLGRAPMTIEIKESGLTSINQIQRVFGMTFNQIIQELGWALTGHVYSNKSNEEMLQDYFELYNKLKRIPLMEDINNQSEMANYTTYKNKLGSIRDICNLLNIDYKNEIVLYKSGEGKICFDRNGEQCRSYPEMVISNILIDNEIKFIKEYPYKKVIPNDKTKRNFDWKLQEHDIFIEYFGMFNEKSLKNDSKFSKYTKKAIKKINDCEKANIQLIAILPTDLDNNYFGLIEKLSKFQLKVKIEESYENIF